MGALRLSDELGLAYSSSWAYQMSAMNNPIDYETHYGWIDMALVSSSLGKIGAGYEVLGSDDRMGQFRTPLATAHKFNGWADAFLDNGGPFGLRDAFVYVAPRLPCDFQGNGQVGGSDSLIIRARGPGVVLNRSRPLQGSYRNVRARDQNRPADAVIFASPDA